MQTKPAVTVAVADLKHQPGMAVQTEVKGGNSTTDMIKANVEGIKPGIDNAGRIAKVGSRVLRQHVFHF
ncbi:MAG: hypothetical protein WCK35_28690 [Chloroflexota bacterium]